MSTVDFCEFRSIYRSVDDQFINDSFFPAKFGTRHVQALLMSGSLMISYALRASLSVAIVAMTDAKSTNPDFKVRSHQYFYSFRNFHQ